MDIVTSQWMQICLKCALWWEHSSFIIVYLNVLESMAVWYAHGHWPVSLKGARSLFLSALFSFRLFFRPPTSKAVSMNRISGWWLLKLSPCTSVSAPHVSLLIWETGDDCPRVLGDDAHGVAVGWAPWKAAGAHWDIQPRKELDIGKMPRDCERCERAARREWHSRRFPCGKVLLWPGGHLHIRRDVWHKCPRRWKRCHGYCCYQGREKK